MNETAESKLLIGVDAGGTKTRAVLAEYKAGKVVEIGAGVAGPGNVRSEGLGTSIANIESAIRNAFTSAERSVIVADAACLCVAGAGRDEERELVASAARQAQVASQIKVVSDADVLFASAKPASDDSNRVAICLIAGTGSIAIGRDNAGRTLRCGGWGFLIGDQGSGFAIGRAALEHVTAVADGLVHESPLSAAVLERLQLSAPEELIRWCYSGDDARGRIADLATVVFQCSTDETAAKILAKAASELAAQVCSVASRLAVSSLTLVCGGSLLVKQPAFRGQVVDTLAASGVALNSVCVVERPELGALEIACLL